MQFSVATFAAVATALMWSATAITVETNLDMTALIQATSNRVVCQGGLSDTNICQDQYCGCSGNTIFCLPGTTCLSTCVCAA